MADDAAPVLSRRDGAVQTFTLNRPQALNSFNGEMHDALSAELKAAAADPAVRCVVITGAGRGFCAGQDLSDPAVAPDAPPLPLWLVTENGLAAWLEAQPPGIAAWARQHQFAASGSSCWRGLGCRVADPPLNPVAHRNFKRSGL